MLVIVKAKSLITPKNLPSPLVMTAVMLHLPPIENLVVSKIDYVSILSMTGPLHTFAMPVIFVKNLCNQMDQLYDA